jgi:hypothetical protein
MRTLLSLGILTAFLLVSVEAVTACPASTPLNRANGNKDNPTYAKHQQVANDYIDNRSPGISTAARNFVFPYVFGTSIYEEGVDGNPTLDKATGKGTSQDYDGVAATSGYDQPIPQGCSNSDPCCSHYSCPTFYACTYDHGHIGIPKSSHHHLHYVHGLNDAKKAGYAVDPDEINPPKADIQGT